MKHTLLLIFTLPTVVLVAVTRPHTSSNRETHNSGQIGWKKPVTVEYTVTNTGNEPLVLINVTTPCVCTVADWTKKSIAPSARGAVKASFNARALGRSDKSIGTYDDATPNLVYLKFTGEVVQEVKDYSELPPYAIGNIRIDHDGSSFPDVYRGQQPSMTSSTANLSDRPYEPVLMHLSPYLKMKAESKVLLKGKKGTIKLALGASQLQDFGLTQTSVYLSHFSGDKMSEDNEIPVSAIFLPDFSCMTEKGSPNAPSIHISETNIDLSTSLIKKNKVSHDILIANVDKTPLVISKLQVFNPSVGVRLKKTATPPDGVTKPKVTIRKQDVGNEKHHLRILMTTNDPLCPKVGISVKR